MMLTAYLVLVAATLLPLISSTHAPRHAIPQFTAAHELCKLDVPALLQDLEGSPLSTRIINTITAAILIARQYSYLTPTRPVDSSWYNSLVNVPLTIDGPVPNLVVNDGKRLLGSSQQTLSAPLATSRPVSKETPVDEEASNAIYQWICVVPLTISGPVFDENFLEEGASSEPIVQNSSMPLAINRLNPIDKGSPLEKLVHVSAPLTIDGPIPGSDLLNKRAPTSPSYISSNALTISRPVPAKACVDVEAPRKIAQHTSSIPLNISGHVLEDILLGEEAGLKTTEPKYLATMSVSGSYSIGELFLKDSNRNDGSQQSYLSGTGIAGMDPGCSSPKSIVNHCKYCRSLIDI